MRASLPPRLLLGARRSSSAALPTAKAAAPSRCLLFPGQGSQHVGMGRDLAQRFPAARLVFEEVDAALGVSLSRRMFDPATDAAHLAATEFAQPAILAHSVAAWRALQHELGGGRAHAFPIAAFAAALLGHSLGEYSALVVGESVSLWDAARLVRARGLAMQAACSVPGEQYAMAALARALTAAGARAGPASSQSDRPLEANGCSSNENVHSTDEADFAESIRRVCVDTIASDHELRSRQRVVGAANVNSAAQVVISGHRDAVLTAIERAKAAGLVRRATFLSVSAPFHCSLMRPAADVVAKALESIAVRNSLVPIFSNVDAIARTDAGAIKAQLVLQVTAPVLFDACMRRVRESVAPSSMVELGPGRVLTGLVDTIYRQCAEASAASEAALTGAAKQESDAAKHARAAANKAAAHDRSPHAATASRATIGTADELTAFVKHFGS